MSKMVSARGMVADRRRADGICLRTSRGARKYVTRAERQQVIAAFMARQSDADLFALTLAWTGARISEALALTPQAFDVAGGRHQRDLPVAAERPRLIDFTESVNRANGRTAHDIFGSPGDRQFRACMALFAQAPSATEIFRVALERHSSLRATFRRATPGKPL